MNSADVLIGALTGALILTMLRIYFLGNTVDDLELRVLWLEQRRAESLKTKE